VRAGDDAPFSEGDEVFGRQTLNRMSELNGTYSEYVIVESADIYRKPSNLTHDEAAGVPHACLAAYAALGHVGKLVEKRKQVCRPPQLASLSSCQLLKSQASFLRESFNNRGLVTSYVCIALS